MNPYPYLIHHLLDQRQSWCVTGAAGFIGSHLVETLLRLNQRVLGLDNFSTGSRRNLAQVKAAVSAEQWRNFTLSEGDIRDPAFCLRCSRNTDFILHQAALGSVSRSLADPAATHANNATGLLNVLLAARQNGVRRVVFASSSSVYGDDGHLPKREAQLGNCLSPYALTKRVNELYAEVLGRCFNLSWVGLRYFNVFGARQDPAGQYAAVIPRWVAALLGRQPVFIHGDGETSRDFCYVANVVQANLLAATVGTEQAGNEIYNIAVGARTSLNQLFAILVQKLSRFYPHVQSCCPVYQDFRPGDVRHSEADISKATRLLGYRPSHTLEQGLSEALAWYRQELAPAPKPCVTKSAEALPSPSAPETSGKAESKAAVNGPSPAACHSPPLPAGV